MDRSRKRQRRESDETGCLNSFPFSFLPAANQGFTLPQPDYHQQTVVDRSQETFVCYGMVVGFLGTYTRPSASGNMQKDPETFAVTIQSNHEFAPIHLHHTSGSGTFSSDFIDIIQALLDEASLRLQASCTISGHQQKAQAKRGRFGPISLPCEVSVILYGPRSSIDNIGEFFQELDMYLQDPSGCDWDVPYCNPHRLSSINVDECPMTSDLERLSTELVEVLFQSIPSESDALERLLDGYQDFPEAPQPALILSLLKKHQKQALTFLRQREDGWSFDPESADFWDYRQTCQAAFFVNNISQTCQEEEPPEFYGGIVADPMGLGKTLTMIALIAAEKHSPSPLAGTSSLILVPPPRGLTWRRHYRRDRLSKAGEIAAYDIVLSTYNTVSADWGGGQKAANSLLFSTHWKRIILDEAHMIRNTKSQMSQAVCTLEATARWAVTGTPIQNRIGDLAALLKFIRAHPYDDARRFESDIGQIWKTENIAEAVDRLRKLSGGLILRRPKTVIELPPRVDLKFPVAFWHPERELYDRVKQQTMAKIAQVFRDGDSGSVASSSYITVMQRINALRMICDLGLNYDDRHDLTAAEDAYRSDLEHWTNIAQETFNLEREVSSVVCSRCPSSYDNVTAPFVDNNSGVESTPPSYYAKCLTYICSDCVQSTLRRNQAIVCGHTTNHTLEGSGLLSQLPQLQLSSKVRALVTQLKGLPADTKRLRNSCCPNCGVFELENDARPHRDGVKRSRYQLCSI
ncbi:putative SWI/SNF-related matrix-associated actin-dependent regulator of chromatin subfamily A member 3-like 1 [Staphylotrichum tortipilum]|uniref:SWI/SNF-related matrix-associated actin-dependent regulator of chromatin subfamily A member 3-like 1 n=1 Tax=Staphylotrichum tortipilum TaxID=2831512 RepID=A0AAN6MAX1_9PEZI|nr:putative SWI/SNF-related matrix-associated actin-dependent regulator of chromatin subfamily A member 3-like 1 [Staphylotrichum longicolle]